MQMITNWCARLMLALAGVGFAASANASTIYNFSFIDGSVTVATGSFRTSGPAVDPGYDLIASITFDYLTATDGTVFTGPFTAPPDLAGSAYNPVTGAFLNHFGGATWDDFGGVSFDTAMFLVGIDPSSFTSPPSLLSGVVVSWGDTYHLRNGVLGVRPAVTAVPEPASLLLLGTGLLGAGTIGRARRRYSSDFRWRANRIRA